MKPLPGRWVTKEKYSHLEWARRHVAYWVQSYFEDPTEYRRERLVYWKEYLDRREKELEDEQA